MKFTRQHSQLKQGVVYTGKVYSITVLNEDKDTERVLINVSAKEGQPAPASFATGTEDGARILNQLLDSLEVEQLKDLLGKEVRFSIKPNNQYFNTVLYGKSRTITGLDDAVDPEELEGLI